MEAPHRSLRRTLLFLAKVALATALLAYLVYQAQQDKLFAQLMEQPKNWWLLVAGLVCNFASIVLSFVRWRVLVLAVGIDFRLVEALRLGALGHVLNFVSLGSLGGDLFKAVFLAHKKPGRRTEAIATVIADRLMGLTVMLALASVGILTTGLLSTNYDALRIMILVSTAGGFAGIALLLFVPALTGPRMTGWLKLIPLVGTTIDRLFGAVRTYRNQKPLLLRAAALSLLVDLLYIASFYFVAHGLPVGAPSFAEHLVIVPVASLVGAIPITPAGLGTLEAATEALYRTMGTEEGVGTIVTLAHRLTTLAVACIGVIYYFSYRAEVRDVMAEAERLAEVN